MPKIEDLAGAFAELVGARGQVERFKATRAQGHPIQQGAVMTRWGSRGVGDEPAVNPLRVGADLFLGKEEAPRLERLADDLFGSVIEPGAHRGRCRVTTQEAGYRRFGPLFAQEPVQRTRGLIPSAVATKAAIDWVEQRHGVRRSPEPSVFRLQSDPLHIPVHSSPLPKRHRLQRPCLGSLREAPSVSSRLASAPPAAAHLGAVAAKMQHIDVNEIHELPSLSLALAFADARVFVPASSQQIKEAQLRQRPRWRLALMQLTILKEMKLLSDGRKVDAIVPGKGAIDEAQDGVSCVAVLRENAARVAGKHSFDDAWLAALAEDSNWLLGELRPKGAKTNKPAKSAEALVRDQLFTEIGRRYGQAKKVAVEIWGWKRVDEHFPALLSREVGRGGVDEADEAPPALPAPPV